MSECYVIKPIELTDLNTTCSVAEDEYDEWEAQGYDLDDYVVLTSEPVGYPCDTYYLHKIYKCIDAHLATTRFPPDYLADTVAEGVTARWELVGPTNAWKFADNRSRVATVYENPMDEGIEITVTPGAWVDSLAMLNVEATTITIVMTDPIAGEVYNEELSSVDLRRLNSFYNWFFVTPDSQSDFVVGNLPKYSNATITITLDTPDGSEQIGELVVGSREFIGKLRYGASFGIRDYSTKTTDEDGYPTVTEGIYQDEVKFPLRLDTGSIYSVKNLLASYRATPLVWVGSDDRAETFIYGIYDDLTMVAQSFNHEIATLSVWELS